MADIALVAADTLHVVESIIQATLPAVEAIEAGEAVRIDTAGKFTGSNGSSSTEAAIYGIAVKSVAAGETVTAIRKGVLDGFELGGVAYWAPLYLSDTDGTIAGSAGTVSTIVGKVIPAWANAVAAAADKLLFVDL